MKVFEWLDANGNKINLNSSSTVSTSTSNSSSATKTSTLSNKEKFEKILEFHKNHAPAIVARKEIKVLRNDCFHYMEHVSAGDDEYDRDVVVAIDDSENWVMCLFTNGKKTIEKIGKGFEELLRILNFYLTLPNSSSKEYQELLESVESSIATEFKLYENLWN